MPPLLSGVLSTGALRQTLAHSSLRSCKLVANSAGIGSKGQITLREFPAYLYNSSSIPHKLYSDNR